MANPVDTVVIHSERGDCHTVEACEETIRSLQNRDMDLEKWDDLGYSFVIGPDRVYECRGWSRVGAHTPPYNNRSIGIAFIGDYYDELPSEAMLSQCEQLINYGVCNSHIRPDYQLFGHRQVRGSPGDKLYNLIQTWSQWTAHPVQ